MTPTAIPWTQIKAMSFDIFGTLVDWEGGMWEGVKASAIGPHVHDREHVMGLLSDHDIAIQAESPTMLQRDVIAEGFRRTALELKLVEEGKLTEAELDATAKEYGNTIGSYKAFPDTTDAIQRLGMHYKLIPVTNVDNQSFSGTLKHALSGCHFDAIYTAEDIGSYKPDLRNFQYLVDHLKQDFGIEQSQLCHTAQSLRHDHRPAKKFGLPYKVWVDRQGLIGGLKDAEYDSYEINLKVNTLKELADIVDAAFEKA